MSYLIVGVFLVVTCSLPVLSLACFVKGIVRGGRCSVRLLRLGLVAPILVAIAATAWTVWRLNWSESHGLWSEAALLATWMLAASITLLVASGGTRRIRLSGRLLALAGLTMPLVVLVPWLVAMLSLVFGHTEWTFD